MMIFETGPSPNGWRLTRNGQTISLYPSQQDAEDAATRIADATIRSGNIVRIVMKRQDHTVKREFLVH